MPLIPRTSETAQIQASSPVQIAATSDARIAGNAIAEFGGAIQKVAGAADDFYAKEQLKDYQLTREEFRDRVMNTAKLAQANAEKNAAPDGSNYGQEFYKVAEPATAELINQYGKTPELRKEFESYASRMKNDIDTNIQIKSAQMLESNNFRRAEGLMDSSATRLREDIPLQDKSVANFVRAEISSNQNLMNGMNLGPQNSEKAQKAFLGQGASAFIDGLGNKQRYGEALKYLTATQKTPDMTTTFQPAEAQALGFISSKEAEALTAQGQSFELPLQTTRKGEKVDPAITHLLSGLTEPQRASAIDKMRAKIQEQVQVKASDLNASISGYEKFRMQGGDVTDAERAKVVQDINAMPHATGVARQRLLDRVMTADAIGDQMKVAATTPRSQLGGLVNKAMDVITTHVNAAAERDPKLANNNRDFAVIENRQQALTHFQTALAQMQKQQDDDPAGFLMKNDPDVALAAKGIKDGTGVEQFTTTLMSKQRYLGIPQAAVSKQQAYGIAQQLATNPDPMATNDFMNSLQSQYGKHFPEVMKQVAKEDKSLAPLQALVYADPYARASAVDAIKAGPQLKIEFAKPERKVQEEQIDLNAQKVIGNFRTAVLGGTNDTSRLGVVQSMQDLIKIQAQRDVLRGADPQDAVKKAYSDIVDANYAVVSGGNSSVLVPRQIVPDAKIVQSFLTVYQPKMGYGSTTQYDTKADPNNPGGVITTPIGAQSNTNADLMRDFNIAGDKSSLRNMRWVTNEAQTGMKLMETMPDGSLQPIYNKSKQKVEVSYDDINMRPNKKVIEANKTVLQKMFGG